MDSTHGLFKSSPNTPPFSFPTACFVFKQNKTKNKQTKKPVSTLTLPVFARVGPSIGAWPPLKSCVPEKVSSLTPPTVVNYQ